MRGTPTFGPSIELIKKYFLSSRYLPSIDIGGVDLLGKPK
jgi:hypothetical protein